MSLDRDRSSLFVPPSTQDHIKGVLNAIAVLVMYGDYQCSQSADVYRLIKVIGRQLSVSLGENYLCFIFRHFPQIEIHCSSHIHPLYNNEFVQVEPNTFPEVFAQDVDIIQARVMAAVQKPIAIKNFSEKVTQPAWKSKGVSHGFSRVGSSAYRQEAAELAGDRTLDDPQSGTLEVYKNNRILMREACRKS